MPAAIVAIVEEHTLLEKQTRLLCGCGRVWACDFVEEREAGRVEWSAHVAELLATAAAQ